MKKIIIVLLLSMLIVGCGTPRVQKYFEVILKSLQDGNVEEMGKLNPKSEFSVDDEWTKIVIEGYKKMAYKIKNTKVDGDVAIINLDIKAPDLTYYFPEFIKKVYELIFADPENIKEDDEEFVNNFFKEKLNLKDLKYSKKNINVYLRKEGNDWLVDEEESKNDDFNEMITLGLLKLDDGLIWGFPENDEE